MSSSAIAGNTIFEFPAGMIMPYAGSSTPAGWLECDGAEVDISAYPILASALGSMWNNAKNPLTGATYSNPAAGKFRLPDLRGSFLRGSSGGAANSQGVATGLAEFQGNKTAKNGLAATAAASSLTALSMNSSTTSVSGNRNQFNRTSANNNVSHTHGFTSGGQSANHVHQWTAYIQTAVGDGGVFHTPTVGDKGGGLAYTTQIPTDGVSANHTHSGSTGGVSANHTHGITYDSTFSASGTTPAQTLNSSTVEAQVITINAGDAETRPDAVGIRYLIKI